MAELVNRVTLIRWRSSVRARVGASNLMCFFLHWTFFPLPSTSYIWHACAWWMAGSSVTQIEPLEGDEGPRFETGWEHSIFWSKVLFCEPLFLSSSSHYYKQHKACLRLMDGWFKRHPNRSIGRWRSSVRDWVGAFIILVQSPLLRTFFPLFFLPLPTTSNTWQACARWLVRAWP